MSGWCNLCEKRYLESEGNDELELCDKCFDHLLMMPVPMLIEMLTLTIAVSNRQRAEMWERHPELQPEHGVTFADKRAFAKSAPRPKRKPKQKNKDIAELNRIMDLS